MKWIGQHIYDLASRFRNDVFLEDISTGTIASGAHLGLDSNNKIVKAVDGGGDLTSIVAGTGLSGTSLTGPIPTLNVDASQTQITAVGTIGTGVWQGTAITAAYIAAAQTNITSLGTLTALDVDNININGDTITASGDMALVATGNDITVDTDNLIIESATSDKPRLTLKATNTTAGTSGELKFLKDAADVGDGEYLGEIGWYGDNDAGSPEEIRYARIFTRTSDVTDGSEAGNMFFHVASYDGASTSGLQLIGGTGADGEVDVTIASGAASTTTVAGDLTVNGDTVTFQSANADDPHVVIKNTNNGTNEGARLDFNKLRADDGVEVGQNLGEIWFTGQDGAQNAQDYAYIVGEIDVGTHGQESGQIVMGVATHDGDVRTGLTLTGGSVNDEIDVIIGNGAASTTTIAGTLTMGSTATLNNTGEIQVASQPSITTLAGLTSLGAAGATTDIAAGDLTMYNAVNDGVPTISIGSSATERLEITANYASGTQQLNQAIFTTYTASGTSNRGRFVFSVDETTALQIWDAGLNLSENMALQINGTAIISDSSGTATLSNIDALDATTEATIEAAMDTLPNVTSLGTLTGLTTSGAIELGHATDTTIARSAAGVVTIEGDQIITSKPTTVGSGQSGQLGMQIARRTITQAEMNDLHNTPIAIVPALGANLVAIPVNGTIFVDRAANQTVSAQLVIGYGSGTYQNSIYFFKRFHRNISTDFHYGLDMYVGNFGTSMTAGVNTAINASADVAYTNNAFTSVDVYINYYVIDRS